jgi:hypothetical protein
LERLFQLRVNVPLANKPATVKGDTTTPVKGGLRDSATIKVTPLKSKFKCKYDVVAPGNIIEHINIFLHYATLKYSLVG